LLVGQHTATTRGFLSILSIKDYTVNKSYSTNAVPCLMNLHALEFTVNVIKYTSFTLNGFLGEKFG